MGKDYWRIWYLNCYGDSYNDMIPVPAGTSTFKVKTIAKRQLGAYKITRMKKQVKKK